MLSGDGEKASMEGETVAEGVGKEDKADERDGKERQVIN